MSFSVLSVILYLRSESGSESKCLRIWGRKCSCEKYQRKREKNNQKHKRESWWIKIYKETMVQRKKTGLEERILCSELRNCVFVNSVSNSLWQVYIQNSFELDLKLRTCSNQTRCTGEMNKEVNLVYSATHVKFSFF